jgi:hypothetical protein
VPGRRERRRTAAWRAPTRRRTAPRRRERAMGGTTGRRYRPVTKNGSREAR